jgi:hypothetical protein
MPPPQAPSTQPTEAAPTPPPEAPKAAQEKGAAPGSSSSNPQQLTLHTGRAAAAVAGKPSGALGRITKLTRDGRDLGHLLPYAEQWNAADMSPATRGLGKDRLPVPDPAGPRCTEEHFARLRRAVRELDNAWHDATNNLVVSLTKLFNFMNSCRFLSFRISSIFPVPEFYVESAALSTKL